MHMRTVGFRATILLGVLLCSGCSKPAATVESTPAPRATTKAVAAESASPVKRTPAAAAAPTHRVVATTPKVTPPPVRKTSPPATARPPARPSPSAASVVAVAGDAVHGKQLYLQSCSSCHGAAAQGGMGPSLEDEASRKDLSQAIAWIKNPAPPMPKLYPGSLSAKDVLDVATYVESLK